MKKRQKQQKDKDEVGAVFVWVPVLFAAIYLAVHSSMLLSSLYYWGGIFQALVFGQ